MKKIFHVLHNDNIPDNIKFYVTVWYVFKRRKFRAFYFKVKSGMSYYYAHKQVSAYKRKEIKEYLKEIKKETPQKKINDLITFIQNK